jgi:RNA polymerase sigma-70 factor (ECF subfamily)
VNKIDQLVKKAERGDSSAYLELFCEYEEDIYRMAFLYVKNEDDALDVVQETAYRSFKSISNLKDARFYKTWLIRIAIRCAIDLLRQRKKVKRLKPEQSLAIDVNEDISLSLTVYELLTSLNEDEKGIILLHYYHDYTIKEVAEVLGIPLGTAKSTLYRALTKLRVRVKEEDIYER